MTKIERLKKLSKWLIYIGYADNDAELASKLGYTKSSFSQIMNEKVPLSDKFIDKMCSVYENINKVWILTEKGKMINNEIEFELKPIDDLELYNSEKHEIKLLLEKLQFQASQIDWYKQQLEYLTDQLTSKNNTK